MKTIQKILFLLLVPVLGFSQGNTGNAQQKPIRADEIRFTDQFRPMDKNSKTYVDSNDFKLRKPISYPFVRPADVMWSKTTWEIIDLREKMNHPIYYPTDTLQNRKSLIMAICEGIKEYKFDAYKPSFKSNAFEFNEYISPDSLYELDRTVLQIPSLNTFIQRWNPDEITQILVKEVWYFDKKASKLKCEIIGLCFIRDYEKTIGYQSNQFIKDRRSSYLFWIYYPEARDFLSKVPVYNPYNNTELYSFDDLFVNRKFKSYFVREANVYNDRMITDYVSDREAQLESERIKKEIFDYEQDLWEN